MTRNEILKNELLRIVDIIKTKDHPLKIILFGSLAGNNTHEWSDIDLAVIKESKSKFSHRIYELLNLIKPKYSINILVYTPEEVQYLEKNKNYFWENEICKKGKVLYAEQVA